MVVTVRIPGVLRSSVGGAAHVTVDLPESGTLGDVLDTLSRVHPALERRLRDEQGALRRYVNCYVDGEDCRQLRGLQTPVADGTELEVIPSVAGG